MEASFRDGVERERPYDSRWTPGSDELITLPASDEVTAINARVNAGILALEEIDGAAFESERIRALAAVRGDAAHSRLLLQSFSLSQRLSRKMALISNNNIFDKIDTSAFTLSNHLDSIVENGLIKFKLYNTAKRIFDLSSHYREATDAEIRLFTQSEVLSGDADYLISVSTQPLRKLISSVQSSGVLARETAESIRRKAAGLVPVEVRDAKVVLPRSKSELKDLLAFLDHKIYRSPVDDDPYGTNSHRRRA